VGGAGFINFLRVTNTSSGVTNPGKTFRINQVGGLGIVNNAYNSEIFNVTDGGILQVGGGNTSATINNSPTTNYLLFNNNGSSIYDDGNMEQVTLDHVRWRALYPKADHVVQQLCNVMLDVPTPRNYAHALNLDSQSAPVNERGETPWQESMPQCARNGNQFRMPLSVCLFLPASLSARTCSPANGFIGLSGTVGANRESLLSGVIRMSTVSRWKLPLPHRACPQFACFLHSLFSTISNLIFVTSSALF
jgi:hypothetical protein